MSSACSTGSKQFSPSPRDPRFVPFSVRRPVDSDFPVFIRVDDQCTFSAMRDFFDFCPQFNTAGRAWIPQSVATSPIPVDTYPPTGDVWLYDVAGIVRAGEGWSNERVQWGWALGGNFTRESSLARQFPKTHLDYTHWYPRRPDDAACPVRAPRFPEGNPPEGFRFLGEGETVRRGDSVWFRRHIQADCTATIGFKIGILCDSKEAAGANDDVESDFTHSPFLRSLAKPANTLAASPEEPTNVQCPGTAFGSVVSETLHPGGTTYRIQELETRVSSLERTVAALLSWKHSSPPGLEGDTLSAQTPAQPLD